MCDTIRIISIIIRKKSIFTGSVEQHGSKTCSLGPQPDHSEPECQKLQLNNTEFTGNELEIPGSVVLCTRKSNIQVRCGSPSTCFTGDELKVNPCRGEDSTQQQTRLLGIFMSRMTIFPNSIEDHASGELLKGLNVTLLDEFCERAPIRARLIVDSASRGVQLSGSSLISTIQSGMSNLTGITLRARPGEYNLNITSESFEPTFQPVSQIITAHVPKCKT